MTKLLDGLITLGAGFSLLILLTGGGMGNIPGTGIPLSVVDPWMLLTAMLIFFRTRWVMAEPAPILRAASTGIFHWILQPRVAQRFTFYFLAANFLLLTLAHFLRHWALETDAYDVTFVHQSLFWPFASPFLKCDLCIGGSYLGEHLSFTLVLLAPFTAPLKSDGFIFLIQGLFTFAPLLWVLHQGPLRRQKQLWAIAILVFLCCRGLRNSMVWDFREDHLGFFFFLGASLSLYRGWKRWYWIFLVLALLTKENFAVIAAFLAFPILKDSSLFLTRTQRRNLALGTVFLSGFYILISFKFLIPYFNSTMESANNIVIRLGQFGSTPREIFLTILTSPAAWWELGTQKFFTIAAFRYLLLLLGPCVYFLRKSAWWLLPAIPGILMNLLSDLPNQRTMRFHYELAIYPFLIFGTLIGIREVWSQSPLRPRLLRPWRVGLLLALCFSGAWPMYLIRKYLHTSRPTAQQAGATRFLREISQSKTIDKETEILAADSILLAHFSDFKSLRLFRVPPSPISDQPWETFWKFNATDRTGIAGHHAGEANLLLLNRREPWQDTIFHLSLTRGWRSKALSPSGDLVLLEQKK